MKLTNLQKKIIFNINTKSLIIKQLFNNDVTFLIVNTFK